MNPVTLSRNRVCPDSLSYKISSGIRDSHDGWIWHGMLVAALHVWVRREFMLAFFSSYTNCQIAKMEIAHHQAHQGCSPWRYLQLALSSPTFTYWCANSYHMSHQELSKPQTQANKLSAWQPNLNSSSEIFLRFAVIILTARLHSTWHSRVVSGLLLPVVM